MDFKTNEGVTEIFRSMGCLGNDNCFFVTYKDYAKNTLPIVVAGGLGGAVAAAAAGAAQTANQKDLSQYEGLLINQNERGLGIIPLRSAHGMQWMVNVAKMTPIFEEAVFIPNEMIESIEVKNFNFLNKKVQKVYIRLKGVDNPIYQLVRIKEKEIPYQEVNFVKFMEKYHK